VEASVGDISMPLMGEWGDQVTHEIVRRLIEERGFDSLERPGEFPAIIRTQFSAAVCAPAATSIERTYATAICGSKPALPDLAAKMVNRIQRVWSQTKVKTPPTPGKVHSFFSLRGCC
jgi:hypothetical protein